MKAAVLTQINCPLEIKDVELTALKVGQVKVRVEHNYKKSLV